MLPYYSHEKMNFDYQAALKEAKHAKVEIDDEIASLQAERKVSCSPFVPII